VAIAMCYRLVAIAMGYRLVAIAMGYGPHSPSSIADRDHEICFDSLAS
jgi:hypothetical protein